jgi:hypothetical protein
MGAPLIQKKRVRMWATSLYPLGHCFILVRQLTHTHISSNVPETIARLQGATLSIIPALKSFRTTAWNQRGSEGRLIEVGVKCKGVRSVCGLPLCGQTRKPLRGGTGTLATCRSPALENSLAATSVDSSAHFFTLLTWFRMAARRGQNSSNTRRRPQSVRAVHGVEKHRRVGLGWEDGILLLF